MPQDNGDPTSAAPKPGARRAELEALFSEWEARGAPPGEEPPQVDDLVDAPWGSHAPRARVDPVRLRLTFTILLAGLAGWALWFTRADFAYWWSEHGTEPQDLGSLSARYKAGERQLDTGSNIYVKLDGMFSTYESESGEPSETLHYFIDPLFRIVVRTEQPFPTKESRGLWHLEIDPAFAEIVATKRAFPTDLTATFSGTGRLVKASEAPSWATTPLRFYAARLGVDPHDLWIFIDGDPPEAHTMVAVLWGVAPLFPILSLLLLVRAWRRSRRRAHGRAA